MLSGSTRYPVLRLEINPCSAHKEACAVLPRGRAVVSTLLALAAAAKLVLEDLAEGVAGSAFT
jgi:hypothetical protein